MVINAVHKYLSQYRSACIGRCTGVGEPENAMKRRKVLLPEEVIKLETKRVREFLKHDVSSLCTGKNRTKHIYDKHKHLSSSLHRGFCTSLLFIQFI